MLLTVDAPSRLTRTLEAVGQHLVKAGGDAVPAYDLVGTLYRGPGDYVLLSVPNALVRGVFSALHAPGAELPPGYHGGPFTAHITVFRPDETALVGGADRISERGKQFTYSLGRLVTVVPEGWAGVSKAYLLTVHSPALQALRRSYGLASLPNQGKFAFHIACAVIRRGVLGRTGTSKAQAAPPPAA